MLPYKIVHCPDLFASDQGESERNLIQCFEPPADTPDSGKFIVVLEEIDVLLGSNRADTLEARMASLLLDCIDSTSAFVLGTTSLPATLSEEIQRPGRLDTLVELHLKDAAARAAVLKIMLRRFGNIADSQKDIAQVAKKAYGFSPADLQNLCVRAFMEHRDVTVDDLLKITETIVPSSLSSFQSKIPRVMFSDIFGMDEVIARVRTLVLEPLCEPERFYEMKVEPPRGALVYGPPGTGKSMLCCAIANELAVNTIWVDASQVRSMIVGETERALADLFAQARKSSPCILLFDHIDALAPQRGTSLSSENTSDRIVTSLLVEMDGFGSHGMTDHLAPSVFVLAVTSRPHIVDPALLRPGRLDIHVGLDLPTAAQRMSILEGLLGKMPAAASISGNGDSLRKLVERTHGCTGADLANVCREAALCALRRDINSEMLTMADFEQSMNALNI
ncbi:hypothetical protein IWW36_003049 [Coemansia brasiliensis]|uniref:AAA+ ATPase domain-containing protein n=1 Tax=Coemansia brasiliensis TaxID=2650707 RepID=A0A9W8LYX5_9FUNG|nr:hypothetical protein IWW36_003049 [Coemansia brasiliensis]